MNGPYGQRFNLALGMLAGVAVAAIVIAIALLAKGSSPNDNAPWSAWAPADGGLQGAREIADHLAPLYRISGVDQLAVVTVSAISDGTSTAAAAAGATGSSATSSSSTSPGLEVAVRPDPNSSAVSLISGKTIAYNLCGLGSSNCAIGVGSPSADRLLLLRREALELALYTFRYISGVQNVVALLPPGHQMATASLTSKPPSGTSSQSATKPLDLALLFQHQELQPFLSQPLSALFPEPLPPTIPQVPLWKQTTEAGYVAQITERGMFSEHLTTAQDGTNLLVLDPLPPS